MPESMTLQDVSLTNKAMPGSPVAPQSLYMLW